MLSQFNKNIFLYYILNLLKNDTHFARILLAEISINGVCLFVSKLRLVKMCLEFRRVTSVNIFDQKIVSPSLKEVSYKN